MDPTATADADKNAAGQPRFEEQCYLLWNWPTFVKLAAKQTYKNFVVMMGEPSSIINRLQSRRGIERLFEIQPYEASMLVPKIRIFKRVPKGDNGIDREIIFSDHTSKNSIDNMMKSGHGRGDGIGIKSFDYDLQGGSKRGGQAMVKGGNTKINFKFLFQNLEMLLQREKGRPGLIDVVTHPVIPGKETPTCDEGTPANISQLWETREFQMKVVYGWATPTGGLLGNDLKAAIAGSSTTLMVTYQSHELDFKQDGTVELDVTANGYADSVMRDKRSDILWLDEAKETMTSVLEKRKDDAVKELDDAKKEKTEADKAMKAEDETQGLLDDAFGADTAAEKAADTADEKVDAAEPVAEEASTAYNQQVAANKIYMYSRITNALNDSGKLFYIDLTPEQVKAYEDDVKTTLEARQPSGGGPAGEPKLDPTGAGAENSDAKGPEDSEKEIAESKPADQEATEKSTADGNESSQPEIKPQTANPGDTPIGENNTAVENAVKEHAEGNAEDAEKALTEHNQENLARVAKPNTNKRLFYLYYGDLLDVAFNVLQQNPAASNIRAMIGPIAFTDAKTNTKTILNLADVAISLNKFLEWWNNNVVAKDRQEYLLQDFVKDTIKGLIHAALGENCWSGQGGPKPSPEVSVQPMIVPGTGPNGKEDRIPKGGRLNIDDISSVNIQDLVPGAENRDIPTLHIYIYIYSYAWSMGDLKGDREADQKNGIYHLHIGGDRGLVKTMKFSKSGNSHLDAHRATTQGCDMRHLQQQYKITVEMIGNAIFKPGMTIYINPSTMGSGDPQARRTITEKLGLGGYYTVNKVSGDVGDAGFRTTIEAIKASTSTGNTDPKTMAPTDGAEIGEPPVDAAPPAEEEKAWYNPTGWF